MNIRMWLARWRRVAMIMPGLLLLVSVMSVEIPVARAEDDPFEALGIAKFEEPAESVDFALMSTDGEEIRLSDFAGKVVLLNFWTTW